MRIGADGSWMQWSATGLSRYSDGLLHALARRLGGDELVVYYNSRHGRSLFEPPVVERFIRLPNRTAWTQVRLPVALRRDRVDVFLAPAIVAPVATSRPCVPVIHDCLAFRDPAAKPGREGRYWRTWTRLTARRAPVLIADSGSGMRDMVRYLGTEPRRIRIVAPGLDARFTAGSDGERRAGRRRLTAGGVPERFVLHVGAFDPHKNSDLLAEAVARLRAAGEDLALVRCGPGGGASTGMTGVTDLGRVTDDTLVDLYRCAAVAAVPSSYEGFGLPVLEAMACATLVVSTRAGGLVDAGGDIAVYAERADVDSLASALAAALRLEPRARSDRIAAGVARAGAHSWDAAAAQVHAALREATISGCVRSRSRGSGS